MRLLETTAYRELKRHRSAFIAKPLGISSEEVDACLERLALADVVERRGGRFVIKSQGVVDTQGGKQALNSLRAHWSRVAAERLTAPRDEDFFAYNVTPPRGASFVMVDGWSRVHSGGVHEQGQEESGIGVVWSSVEAMEGARGARGAVVLGSLWSEPGGVLRP